MGDPFGNPEVTASPSSRAARRLRFGEDDRGATAVEFALVVFPLITLLLLVLEVGLNYWTSAVLDNAVHSAVRVFYTDAGASSSSTTRRTARRRRGSPMSLPAISRSSQPIARCSRKSIPPMRSRRRCCGPMTPG